MSYHIYTTDGIILRRVPVGESSISLYILTMDLGLIIATAQAARAAVSKLRPALQEYSHVSVSCVKGKNGWKVTNVTEKTNFFFDYPEYIRKKLSKIASMILQMMPGESPHPEIFQTVKGGFEFMKSVEEKDLPNFEILTVLRILYQLGYVERKLAKSFLENMEWSQGLLEEISKDKKNLVELINKALKESHL